VPGGFGENCSFNGQTEECGQGTDLRFEIYIRRDVKLPVKNEVQNYIGRMHRYDSYSLIGHTKLTEEMGIVQYKKSPAEGTLPRFDLNAFGLVGVQGEKVVWPIATLYLDEFRGQLYDGTLDYIALQGSSGHFRNERMLKQGVQEFVIVMRGQGDRNSSDGRALREYAHVIRLPKAFSAQVQALDLGDGEKWQDLARQAAVRATGQVGSASKAVTDHSQ